MKKLSLLLVLVLSMGACSTKESESQQNEKAFLAVVKGKTLVNSATSADFATFTADGKFVNIIGATPADNQQWMLMLTESATVAIYRQDDATQRVDWKFTINGGTGITITAGNKTYTTTFK